MLFAIVPYTAVATWRNLRNDYVNFKIGLVMVIGATAGVVLGAFFTDVFPDLLLKIIFVIIVFYLMVTLRIPTNSSFNFVARGFNRLNFIPPFISCSTAKGSKCSIPSLIILGMIAGFFSGLLGIGGGFLYTPVLIVGVLFQPKVAVGTSLFMILIAALFGAAEHAMLGHIQYDIAIAITIGMMLGAYIGTHILKNLAEDKIKTFIFIAMFIAGILIFFR